MHTCGIHEQGGLGGRSDSDDEDGNGELPAEVVRDHHFGGFVRKADGSGEEGVGDGAVAPRKSKKEVRDSTPHPPDTFLALSFFFLGATSLLRRCWKIMEEAVTHTCGSGLQKRTTWPIPYEQQQQQQQQQE